MLTVLSSNAGLVVGIVLSVIILIVVAYLISKQTNMLLSV